MTNVTMTNEPMKKSPPWIEYCHKIEELFKYDSEVRVEYDDDSLTIRIYVDNADKSDALAKILPGEKNFGGVVVKTIVIPSNLKAESCDVLFRRAFKDNPIVKDVIDIDDVFKFNICYVVMSGKPVQFYNDNLGDLYGNETMLYQDIARDIFGDTDYVLFFCTEKLS